MGYDDLPNEGWGEDPLAPARGCINGLLIGAGIWLVIGFIWWMATR